MTPFAHAAAGYLVTQMAGFIKPDFDFNTPIMITAGIVAGNFPDLDFLFVKDKFQHRNTITHAPLFWIAIISLLFFGAGILKNDQVYAYVLVFSLGIFSHFFADWYAAREENAGGIRLFYPFSKKHYGLMTLKKKTFSLKNIAGMLSPDFLKYYMENRFLFYSELLLIVTGAVIFFAKSMNVFLDLLNSL